MRQSDNHNHDSLPTANAGKCKNSWGNLSFVNNELMFLVTKTVTDLFSNWTTEMILNVTCLHISGCHVNLIHCSHHFVVGLTTYCIVKERHVLRQPALEIATFTELYARRDFRSWRSLLVAVVGRGAVYQALAKEMHNSRRPFQWRFYIGARRGAKPTKSRKKEGFIPPNSKGGTQFSLEL